MDLVGEGWDIAIRIGGLSDSPLQARRLSHCTMHVCAAPRYLDERGVPRKVAKLVQHNCLSYSLSAMQSNKEWRFGRHGEHRVPVSSNLAANNGDALLAAALQGQGILYQPDFIVNDALAQGTLVDLQLDKPPADLGGVQCSTHQIDDHRRKYAR